MEVTVAMNDSIAYLEKVYIPIQLNSQGCGIVWKMGGASSNVVTSKQN